MGNVGLFTREVREGLPGKVTFELRPEGNGERAAGIVRKRVPSRRNSRCKGPEGAPHVQGTARRPVWQVEVEVREVTEGQAAEDLVLCCKDSEPDGSDGA